MWAGGHEEEKSAHAAIGAPRLPSGQLAEILDASLQEALLEHLGQSLDLPARQEHPRRFAIHPLPCCSGVYFRCSVCDCSFAQPKGLARHRRTKRHREEVTRRSET